MDKKDYYQILGITDEEKKLKGVLRVPRQSSKGAPREDRRRVWRIARNGISLA